MYGYNGLQARHVVCDARCQRLFAVYTADVSHGHLRGVALQLARVRGVQTNVFEREVPQAPQGFVRMLGMQVFKGGDEDEAARKMRRLTNPQLTYTMSALHVRLRKCVCDAEPKVMISGSFVNGFSPRAVDTLVRDFSKRVGTIDPRLLDQDPAEPNSRFRRFVQPAARSLGIYVCNVFLQSPDYLWICPHVPKQ